MDHTEKGLGTRTIHSGSLKDTGYHSLGMPIYQTSTFYFDTCEQGGKAFAGEDNSFIYTRLGNPTTNFVEEKVAALEGGEAAAATGSGMGPLPPHYGVLQGLESIFWQTVHCMDVRFLC